MILDTKIDAKALVARLKRKYRTNQYKIKQIHNTEQKTKARYLKNAIKR